jgi:hypothetical protein
MTPFGTCSASILHLLSIRRRRNRRAPLAGGAHPRADAARGADRGHTEGAVTYARDGAGYRMAEKGATRLVGINEKKGAVKGTHSPQGDTTNDPNEHQSF